jgi:hypothetical protein
LVGVTDGAGCTEHADLEGQQQHGPRNTGRGRYYRDQERRDKGHDLSPASGGHLATVNRAITVNRGMTGYFARRKFQHHDKENCAAQIAPS